LREGEVVGHPSYHLKSDGSFLYAPIVTIALSLTIQPQLAINNVCDAQYQKVLGDFKSKFWVFPLVTVKVKVKVEHLI